MSEIRVQCIDQAISFLNTPVISSGNVNYDRIIFDFCSRWDGYAKTAIFYRNKDEIYYQLLENDSCLIPNEVLGEKGIVYIGVFGIKDDVTITSQVLTYRIQEGAVTEDLKPADPTPDIYEQIVSRYNHYDERLAYFEDRFNSSVGDAEKLGGQMPDYYATAKSVTDIVNGATKVSKASMADSSGDSNKLGGKNPSEYVLQSEFGAYKPTVTEVSAIDLLNNNLVNGFYYVYGATNAPNGNGYGFYKIVKINENYKEVEWRGSETTETLKNYCVNGSWSGWKTFFTTDGGEINGTLVQNVNGDLYHVLKNQNRSISNMISANGVYEIYDSTNAKTIIRSTLDGSTTFNGKASENVPKTGSTTITGDNNMPIRLRSKASNNVYQGFETYAGSFVGALGFNASGKPSFLNSAQSTESEILHTGNVGSHALTKNNGIANNITLKNAESGYGMIYKNHTDTTDNGTYLKDFSADGKEIALYLLAKDNAFSFKDNSGSWNKILHTGNSARVTITNSENDVPSEMSGLWAY